MFLIAGALSSITAAKKKATTPAEITTAQKVAPVKLSSSIDSLSYYIGKINALGYMGSLNKKDEFNKEEFIKGLNSIVNAQQNNPSLLQGIEMGLSMIKFQDQAERQFGEKLNVPIMMGTFENVMLSGSKEKPAVYQDSIQKAIKSIMARKGAEMEKKGIDYVKSTMKKDSTYKITPSGLVYKMSKAGNGKLFKESDKIKVNYTGYHIDGKVFDSSKGKAVTFSPSQVVPGFKEALLMMSPGAECRVLIPGHLAYGAQGNPQGGIGPNELLIFEIATVEVVPETETKPATKPATVAQPAKKAIQKTNKK